jgi:hypothetical protein
MSIITQGFGGADSLILQGYGDTAPVGTSGNIQQTLSFSWSDGNGSVSTSLPHFGDTEVEADISVSSNSTQNFFLPVLCSSNSVPICLFYALAVFVADVGPLTAVFHASLGDTTLLFSPGVPFVWSSLTSFDDFLPNGVTGITITNPNSTSATLRVRALLDAS